MDGRLSGISRSFVQIFELSYRGDCMIVWIKSVSMALCKLLMVLEWYELYLLVIQRATIKPGVLSWQVQVICSHLYLPSFPGGWMVSSSKLMRYSSMCGWHETDFRNIWLLSRYSVGPSLIEHIWDMLQTSLNSQLPHPKKFSSVIGSPGMYLDRYTHAMTPAHCRFQGITSPHFLYNSSKGNKYIYYYYYYYLLSLQYNVLPYCTEPRPQAR